MATETNLKSVAEIVAAAGGCDVFLRLHSKPEEAELRDTFALIAFAGMMRKPDCFHLVKDAQHCYQIADAMLAARKGERV